MKLKSTIMLGAVIVGSGALLGITGCKPSGWSPKSAQADTKTSNTNFDVELLFVNDGVKVYRFYDAGRYRYYTDARGSVQWSEQSGKTTTTQEIPTAK